MILIAARLKENRFLIPVCEFLVFFLVFQKSFLRSIRFAGGKPNKMNDGKIDQAKSIRLLKFLFEYVGLDPDKIDLATTKSGRTSVSTYLVNDGTIPLSDITLVCFYFLVDSIVCCVFVQLTHHTSTESLKHYALPSLDRSTSAQQHLVEMRRIAGKECADIFAEAKRLGQEVKSTDQEFDFNCLFLIFEILSLKKAFVFCFCSVYVWWATNFDVSGCSG